MRRTLITTLALIALMLPTSARAQGGDASWLNSLEGLESAIGRSWMAPIVFTETSTLTEYNAASTAISETTTTSTPTSTAATPAAGSAIPLNVSVLIYQFDSAEHAAAGLDLLNADQLAQIERDPRSPATNAFSPENLGDRAYGHEGTFAAPTGDGSTVDLAVVYLMVQNGDLVYQVFGQFSPGDHIAQTTAIAESLVQTPVGPDDAVYDMNGGSTGGLWEKLNGVDAGMVEGSTVSDLQMFPPADDATIGDSVVVPVIDLDNLGAVPGLGGSWSIAYGTDTAGTPVATPASSSFGVFSIELWYMEFEDATYASAAAFSLDAALTEPLGIVTTEGSGFGSEDGSITLVNTGFVRDRSLPEGEAATVVYVSGTTVIASRVYANGPAPTPIAQDLVATMSEKTPSSSDEDISGSTAQGGHWDLFPMAGDANLQGLVPLDIRHDSPAAPATPIS